MDNIIDLEYKRMEKEVEKDVEILKKKINGIQLTAEEREYLRVEKEKRDFYRKTLSSVFGE